MPPKRAKRQGTLTAYFNRSSTPAKLCAKASSRKCIYVYIEHEIQEAKGMEKKRRKFWNEKAEDISKDERYQNSKGDELVSVLVCTFQLSIMFSTFPVKIHVFLTLQKL